jgi:PAS domain S-box-containing protein
VTDASNKETLHQAAPEDLWASEIRYRRLFESARDGILILDADTLKVTDVNPFMVEFLGYSRDEFLGKELWEIGLFKDRDESRAAFQVLQTKGYIRYEYLPLQTKTGEQWNVEFIGNVYQEDDHQVIQCNIRDITERRSTEERLKQSEQRLRTIFEASHEGIVVEENERIHYVNKSYLRLFGYDDDEELIGRHISVVVSHEDAERLLEFGRSRLRGEQPPSEYEFKGKRKDGSLIDVEASVSASNVGDSNYITTMIRDITERKAVEKSIRFQARLLDTVQQSVIATDLDGIVIYWNQFAQKLYGWTMQEAMGRRIVELVTPEVMTERALEIMSHLRRGESRTGEFNVQGRDGATFPVQIINSPIDDEEGNLIGIVGVSIDITERKRQEDSLIELTRQLERQSNVFNTTLSSISDFAYIFDRQGRFIYANQPLLDLWGLKLDEAVGKNFFDLQYPDDLALRLQRQIQQVFDTGQALRDETPYTSPTGAQGFYEYIFTPVKAYEGTVEVVAGSTRDYTERKRVEQALRESENKYRLLMEQASDGIHTYDIQGNFIEVNSKLCEMLGYTSEELLRLNVRDLIPAEELAVDPIRFDELRAGKTLLTERRLRRKDGALLPVEISGRMIQDNVLQSIIRDITERKWAEEALVRLNEQLEQRVAERTVELKGMNDSLQAEIVERRRVERERASILRRLVMAQEEERRRIARDMHDQFGQQLTALLLKLGMLKEDYGEQQSLREQIETLEEVARGLDADFDFLVWELRPTALDDLGLQDALTNFAQNWSRYFRVPVEVLAHGLGKEASTSESDIMLYRIAQEALNNVAKHAHAASVSILLEGRADAVSLIIEDDGVGFDAENTSDVDDKGLGLVGIRERAALVGGTAEIESQPGEGTRVIVRIPTTPPARKGEEYE